jgi:multisubunit Na+/H+ antiporter MnhG subunit
MIRTRARGKSGHDGHRRHPERGFLVLGGGFFCLVGGIGLLRMPDFYTRMHAASVTETLGAGLMLLGLMLQAG